MKRLASTNADGLITKIRRRGRAHTPEEVFDTIRNACFQRWRLLCIVLDSNEMPREIGLVVMHFFMWRNCTECEELVQCPPIAPICIACYNADVRRRPYEGKGILCLFCGQCQLEKCVSCSYTQCAVHGMFDTDETTRCETCDCLICSQCRIDDDSRGNTISHGHNQNDYYPDWCDSFTCVRCNTLRKTKATM